MKLNVIVVSKSAPIQQIDFPSDIARSFEGSMHVRPGTMYQLNDAELEYLESYCAKLIDRVVVSSEKEEPVQEEKEDSEQTNVDKEARHSRRSKREAAKSADFESPALRGINLVDETNESSE